MKSSGQLAAMISAYIVDIREAQIQVKAGST